MLKFHRQLIQECAAIGVAARIENGGKHYKLICQHGGRNFL